MLITASVVGVYLWARWYGANWPGNLKLLRGDRRPWLLPWVPVAAAAVILVTVNFFAASDVVSDTFYVLGYFGLGVLWLAVAELGFRYLGISAQIDIADRGNGAALAAYAGGLIGIALCYSGGNIGEGPGAEVVFFCAGLATVAFFVVWLILTTVTEIDHTVTVDRDLAAGLRLGSFLLAAGVILGRSVTGNWISVEATLVVFVTFSWPVLLLLGLALLIEFVARPTVARPTSPWFPLGILPSAFYLGYAAFYLLAAGLRS